jgi:hypothetical protein
MSDEAARVEEEVGVDEAVPMDGVVRAAEVAGEAVHAGSAPACKICDADTRVVFRVPSAKATGHEIPDAPDDCTYYECTNCRFCFTDLLDGRDLAPVYGMQYWKEQDPDWHGRTPEMLRLALLASSLLPARPWALDILDFGCGMGTFVETAREKLGLQVWGHDIIEPEFGKEFFLRALGPRQFDLALSVEVVEHLVDPVGALTPVVRSLRPSGVFAFQTAHYDPATCGRDWWYVGPANGHVSLFSAGALDVLFKRLGGKRRAVWNGYAGLQAWQF